VICLLRLIRWDDHSLINPAVPMENEKWKMENVLEDAPFKSFRALDNQLVWNTRLDDISVTFRHRKTLWAHRGA
jgi:hypothetical protein